MPTKNYIGSQPTEKTTIHTHTCILYLLSTPSPSRMKKKCQDHPVRKEREREYHVRLTLPLVLVHHCPIGVGIKPRQKTDSTHCSSLHSSTHTQKLTYIHVGVITNLSMNDGWIHSSIQPTKSKPLESCLFSSTIVCPFGVHSSLSLSFSLCVYLFYKVTRKVPMTYVTSMLEF